MHCEWAGHSSEIIYENGSALCPKCGDEDVFPQRHFLCLQCGYKAEQFEFFPELSADSDPEEDLVELYYMKDPILHHRPSDDEECESYKWIQIR